MYQERWYRQTGEANRYEWHPDGADWVSISKGTVIGNDQGFAWVGLPDGSYQLVPGRPNLLVNVKGREFRAGELNYHNPQEERKPMSTIETIRRERREARERGKLEELYAEWDNTERGQVGVFSRRLRGESQLWRCTIVHTHDDRDGEPMWSITGEVNQVPWEDALAWLVDNRIAPEDVSWVA
jgi:hypothetical protein